MTTLGWCLCAERPVKIEQVSPAKGHCTFLSGQSFEERQLLTNGHPPPAYQVTVGQTTVSCCSLALKKLTLAAGFLLAPLVDIIVPPQCYSIMTGVTLTNVLFVYNCIGAWDIGGSATPSAGTAPRETGAGFAACEDTF